jgi:hypothetical protein
MSSGITPKLPLTTDYTFGVYNLITDYETLAIQNLKMLILTNPGERVMDPNFGVGIKRFLFEPATGPLYSEVSTRINHQVAKYLPFVEILGIDYGVPESAPDLFPHTLKVTIHFSIIPLQINTVLRIDLTDN